MKKIMISCDDATLISDKKQYKAANSWELIKMGLHVMMCKSCKVYTQQNDILTQVMEREPLKINQVDTNLTEQEKEVIKIKLKEE